MSKDLQTTKSVQITNSINGQASHIPGLCPHDSSVPEEKSRGRRVGVLETDSDYVKLAKQGGHKGLLWHEQDIMFPKPVSYKRPNWFCPDTAPSDNKLSLEDEKSVVAFQTLEPPFGTEDIQSVEQSVNNNGKEKDTIQNFQMEQPSSLNHLETRYRKMSYNKKPSPVNMSKLLSFGYMDDDITPRSDGSKK